MRINFGFINITHINITITEIKMKKKIDSLWSYYTRGLLKLLASGF